MRLALLLVVLVGCGHPHYTLNVPPPTASPVERLQAFNRLRTRAVGELTTCSYRGAMPDHCWSSQYLVLADGREIWHHEDLLAVVTPDSQAARDHRDYTRVKANQLLWTLGLFAGAAAGIAMIHYGWADEPTDLMWTGVGVTAASVLIGGGGAYITGLQARSAKLRMFAHYDEGLAAQLNICTSGIAIVPCDAPNMPVAPDPVLRSLPQR
jgi:hypothetical protein